MTEPYQFPTDARFRRIAAKIADAVTVAINSGKTIGQSIGMYCPLGCLSGRTRPGGNNAAWYLGCKPDEAFAFIVGFDCGGPCPASGFDYEAFHELGRAYRRRFITGQGGP